MKEPKTYKKLDSSPISKAIESKFKQKDATSKKKIIPTSAISGVREELKKLFLPLLIDIFELRQMVDNYKTASPEHIPLGKKTKSPKEILERLEQLQNDVEESQRWCNGVILQIAKGIEEAREVLSPTPSTPPKKSSWIKKILYRVKR